MTDPIECIQEFIFSVSQVFHVATAHPEIMRAHVRASVDHNTILWLVNLHPDVFVAMLRWGVNDLRAEVTEAREWEKMNIQIQLKTQLVSLKTQIIIA